MTLIDYEAGNLSSVKTALRFLGIDYTVTSDPDLLIKAEKVIFPGVGEAHQAMTVLRSRGMDEAIKSFVASGKPLLGICLGCQILQEKSEERNSTLLGLIPGEAKRFPREKGLKVPQIGWNTISHDNSKLFDNIPQESSFYFIHSYYLSLKLPNGKLSPWVAATAEYGLRFAAALHHDNIWATQFHPEKSGHKGLTLLKNFSEKVF